MASLFADQPRFQPLADKLRPTALEQLVGQAHLLAPGKPLYEALNRKQIHSLILWGPPGVGKTSLASVMAHTVAAEFISLSAVQAGIKDINAAVAKARQAQVAGKVTILFVDEVHRFNKTQQDAFLPHIEDGTLIFIGATTENPSFELNSALLSRTQVYVLKPLAEQDFSKLWQRAQDHDSRLAALSLTDSGLAVLTHFADGDARRFLTALELIADHFAHRSPPTAEELQQFLGSQLRKFDKGGDNFYDQISAFHKSVRGSNPDAALYWLCLLLDGGSDPLYLARRMVRIACEDVGNADPRALTLCLNAWDAQQRLGTPEGELALAQAALYLACAAKSNAVYRAFKDMMSLVKGSPSAEVPIHLRNAPTGLLKALDYGADYRYAHDEPHGYAAGEQYLPDNLALADVYQPVDRGLESKIKAKLAFLRELDDNAAKAPNG